MADDDERAVLPGCAEGGPQVPRGVEGGMPSASGAAPDARPIPGAGAGERRGLRQDVAPTAGPLAEARFEDDGRRARPAAVEVDGTSARVDRDHPAARLVRRQDAPAGEPRGRAAGPCDVDREPEEDARRDRRGQPHDEAERPAAAAVTSRATDAACATGATDATCTTDATDGR